MTAQIRQRIPRSAALILLLLSLFSPAIGADDPLAGDLKRIQGKWKATVPMDGATTVWKLEVKDHKAVIVVESEDGATQFKGEMEFKLEKHGSFTAYTYFNLKVLSGSSEGETRYSGGETKSSLYRFSEGDWITVGGLRNDDDEKPRLITWSRP